MKQSGLLLAGAILSAAFMGMTSCSEDIVIPNEEIYAREFLKNFGAVDPSHKWSVLKESSVDVTVEGTSDVKIYAVEDGETILLADYTGVSGRRTLKFDAPAGTDRVLVRAGAYMQMARLREAVGLSQFDARDVTSRKVTYTIDNGYYWPHRYVSAFTNVLKEGGAALGNQNISADFSFVSDGKPFEFFPMYWNTGAHNELGVYWYENGEMHTDIIFSNNILEDGKRHEHNMYHGPVGYVSGELALRRTAPYNGERYVNRHIKSFAVTFNQWVKAADGAGLTIYRGAGDWRNSQKTDEVVCHVEVSDIAHNTAYFNLPDLDNASIYYFEIPAGAFVTDDKGSSALIQGRFETDNHAPAVTKLEVVADDKLKGHMIVRFGRDVYPSTTVKAEVTPSEGVVLTGPVELEDEEGKQYYRYEYEVPAYSSEYTFNLPAGAFLSVDGDEPSLAKSIKFNSGDEVSENIGGESTDYTSSGVVGVRQGTVNDGDRVLTVADNNTLRPFTVSAKLKPNGSSFAVKSQSGYDFGNNSFPYQVQSKYSGTVTDGSDFDFTKVTGSRAVFLVEPKRADVKLVFYCGLNNGNDAKLYDIVNKEHVDLTKTVYDKDGKRASYEYTVKMGHQYVLYFSNSENGELAGVGYELIKKYPLNEQASAGKVIASYHSPARAAGRGGQGPSDASRVTGELVPGEKYWSSDAEIENDGYFRERTVTTSQSSMNDSYKATETVDGKPQEVTKYYEDDIVTHKISLQFPEGTVFGFFIRNNNGANNIKEKPYYNYSMSALNQELPNSFFANDGDLQEEKYAKGWFYKSDNTGSTNQSKILAGREYSTAATYSTEIDGEEYRFFSFEDYVDCDFNDIVFMVAPTSTSTVVDLEVDTNPYIFAVEDLGAVSGSDIDFNDVVFAVEHVSGDEYAFVTVLAAGGTLPVQLLYDGQIVGAEIGEPVSGPGVGKSLLYVNHWFGIGDNTKPVNVGDKGESHSFGNLTTVKLPVDPTTFTISEAHRATVDALTGVKGFTVKVIDRENRTSKEISGPKDDGDTPQMIVVPGSWNWPREGVDVNYAYPGGQDQDGLSIPSFKDWVGRMDGNEEWHKVKVDNNVILHPWEGSQAAINYRREKQSGGSGN